MASHGHLTAANDENLRLGPAANGVKFGALGLGIVCLVVAVVLSFALGDSGAARAHHARFYHAYLTGFMWCLSIAAAGLFFVMMQQLVKVGWSVNVRRVPEALAGTLPYLGVLAIPLLIPVLMNKGGELYPWAVPHVESSEHHSEAGMHESASAAKRPIAQFADAANGNTADEIRADRAGSSSGDDSAEHGTHNATPGHVSSPQSNYDYMEYDELTQAKQPWLSRWFFTLRIVLYFAIFTTLVVVFCGGSKRQDATGDITISQRLSLYAPVGIIAFGLTLTFAVFDFLMSLDHHWFSTIFGVYVFAGGMIGLFATMVVSFNLVQRAGFLRDSVTVEHFHDIGKFLFAFTFFWGYVGFSQFMLQWYASIPEETPWWARRGVTSADLSHNLAGQPVSGFAGLSIVLLFCHFVIPFVYLISRHIKRSREALLVGAIWMLCAHLVDMYWLVMPEYNNGEWILDLTVIVTILGVIALFVFAFVQTLSNSNLRPIGDPRAAESLAFTNI